MKNFTSEPFSLSKRLETIEEKLSKLQSLKDETINEVSNILKERKISLNLKILHVFMNVKFS